MALPPFRWLPPGPRPGPFPLSGLQALGVEVLEEELELAAALPFFILDLVRGATNAAGLARPWRNKETRLSKAEKSTDLELIGSPFMYHWKKKPHSKRAAAMIVLIFLFLSVSPLEACSPPCAVSASYYR